ncbi:unnamed protein product [Penicillium pancosmium]
MLAPDSRFRFFLSEDWDHEWRVRYRRSFQTALSPYQTRLLNNQSTPDPQTQPTSTSRLSKMLSGNQRATKPTEDEISQYLDGDLIEIEPLQYWRENQSRFPAIAQLARDILSIPATGAGVERLFNTARDICHYRRGRMNSETIEEHMLFLCSTRFNLKEAETKELEQYFSLQEIEAVRELNMEYPEEVEVEMDGICEGL